MENSNLQTLADLAAMMSIVSFIIGTVVLIVFFVMASNIGTITRVIKAIRMEQIDMASSLNQINIRAEREKKLREEAEKNQEHF